MSELTRAMGISGGSLFKAFSSKRSLFQAALERYTTDRHRLILKQLEGRSTGYAGLETLVGFYAASSHGTEGRRGCLVVSAAEEFTILDPEIAASVASALARTRALIEALVREGQEDGSIRSERPAPVLADALLALTQGLRIIGKLGRTEADTLSIVAAALGLLNPAPPADRDPPVPTRFIEGERQ